MLKKEEGFSQKEIDDLFENVKVQKENDKITGGNRILYEFYNGVLLLMDDLCYYKSNIIDINT